MFLASASPVSRKAEKPLGMREYSISTYTGVLQCCTLASVSKTNLHKAEKLSLLIFVVLLSTKA